MLEKKKTISTKEMQKTATNDMDRKSDTKDPDKHDQVDSGTRDVYIRRSIHILCLIFDPSPSFPGSSP